MYMINPHGFKSNIPDWLVSECLAKGFEFPQLKKTSNPASNEVLIHRSAGGLGDLIFMLPAVEDFIKENPALRVTVAVPKEYHPLFTHLPADIAVHTAAFDLKRFRTIYDCLCPCGLHEEAFGYRPAKNRIENFAELLEVRPRRPELRADASLAEGLLAGGELRPPFVGVVVRSARIQKDYPEAFWREVYEGLAKLGLNVLQIDLESRPAPCGNARSLSGLSLDMLKSVLCHVELLITPATGLMVMAGALDTPFLALLGPTDSDMTLKYFDDCDFIQGAPRTLGETSCHVPCYYAQKNGYGPPCSEAHGECMKSIRPEAVLEKVESMLPYTSLALAGQRCLCGSAERTTLGKKDGLEMYRCGACGLARSRRPGKSEYLKFYREQYSTAYQKAKGIQTYPERFQHDLAVAEKRFRKIETIHSFS